MMGHRQKLDGEGFDAFTRWRHLLRWRPSALAKVKRRHNKRARKDAQRVIQIDALAPERAG